MNCSYCHADFEMDRIPEFCPFCGEDIRPAKEKAKDSPGFDFTWGLMHEQNITGRNKALQTSERDEALNCFMKACNTDSAAPVYTASFLKKYPDSSQQLSKWKSLMTDKTDPWNQLSDAEALAASILWKAACNGSIPAALRLIHDFQHPASAETLVSENWTEKLKRLLQVYEAKREAGPVLAAAFACMNHNEEAENYLASWAGDHGITLDSDDLFVRYTGIAPALDERIEQFHKAISLPNKQRLLEIVCRPLKDPDHAFDHLPVLVPILLEKMKLNPDEWILIMMNILSQEELLRGLHLVIQQIRNTEIKFSGLEELSKKHYEKVYMRPYEWIASTDFKMLKNFPEKQ